VVDAILAADTEAGVEAARGRLTGAPPEAATLDVTDLIPEDRRDVLGIRAGEKVTITQVADLHLSVLDSIAELAAETAGVAG
jgi:hypothetical protein